MGLNSGNTGKFRIPGFGTFKLRRWAGAALSALVVVWGAGWVWNSQIKRVFDDPPKRTGQIREIDRAQATMASHGFDEPIFSFSSPDETFQLEGFDDGTICMKWRGQVNSGLWCLDHPDKSGVSTIPPMAVQGAGVGAAQQPPTRCGPYYNQFDHKPLGRFVFEPCASDGRWVRYCFYFEDGCAGYRDYDSWNDVWAPFRWTFCRHR